MRSWVMHIYIYRGSEEAWHVSYRNLRFHATMVIKLSDSKYVVTATPQQMNRATILSPYCYKVPVAPPTGTPPL